MQTQDGLIHGTFSQKALKLDYTIKIYEIPERSRGTKLRWYVSFRIIISFDISYYNIPILSMDFVFPKVARPGV